MIGKEGFALYESLPRKDDGIPRTTQDTQNDKKHNIDNKHNNKTDRGAMTIQGKPEKMLILFGQH